MSAGSHRPARSSDRGERDREALALTIQIVAKRKLAPAAAGCWIVRHSSSPTVASRIVIALVNEVRFQLEPPGSDGFKDAGTRLLDLEGAAGHGVAYSPRGKRR